MTFRDSLKKFSEKYHGEIHLSLGVLTAVIVWFLTGANILLLLLLSVVGAFLPDIDHIFFLFLYGRNTQYATEARGILFSKGVINYIKYCKINHKNNTKIISHNVLLPLILVGLAFYYGSLQEPIWVAFFISNALHFVFDMFEDLVYFGKLNGNWWLRYGQSR